MIPAQLPETTSPLEHPLCFGLWESGETQMVIQRQT